MDHGSHFFYTLEKTRDVKKHVTCLLAEDGTPLTDPEEMCGRARDFYTSLFSPDPTDPGACRVLWEELPTLSVGDRDRLELPLTLAEFSEALHRMPTKKSPGMDRLTVEFYCAFWDILGPDLATVWAESLQGGVLSLSCRRAVLALLPKKGDLRDLRNWRPVSLLSTDYKIVAKAISLWLGSVMADVIYPDQTYTVLGRSIFDNLFLVRDLLELGHRDSLSFTLLSLDQGKAFGRVNHGYLLGTVQAFGFGPQFEDDRVGAAGAGAVAVLSAYADDVLLVVQDPGDLAQLEACQAIYSAASSARVNWVKSSGLAVGDWRQETHTDLTAEDSWRLDWGDRVYFSHLTVHSAGVATLFSPDLRPEVLGVAEAVPGHLLHLWQASAFLGTLDPYECLVLGGDFNNALEEWNRSGTEQCLAAAHVLWEIVEHHSLVDFWRNHHPDDISTFTFVRVEAHRSRHSWLDRIYLSHFHLSRAHSSSIWRVPFSDHHLATVMASLCAERPGPASWHFNNSLLEDVGFMTSCWEFWMAWRGQRHAFPSVRRWWDLGKVCAQLF
ncbi:unnamed protein product [Caretta caretta]